ncbi:thiolase family protein [Kocuria sp. M4R2S49]|uniref:thiolase family protein n=1 Tax=Kocuria rhizosphaericola TaxID=3376284 RepID=UPI0037AABABF
MPVSVPSADAPVLVLGRRTPLARAGTLLDGVPVHRLLAPVFRSLLEDSGLDQGRLADVVVGNAVGAGGNLARLVALEAGLPLSVPGLTVDRQCGSGLDAVVLACRLAQAGAGRAFLAGGAESISTAPLRGRRREDGGVEFYRRAQFAPEHLGDPDMGEAAETVAREHGIDRERQDGYALRSHQRALAAAETGRYQGELVPVAGPRGEVRADNGPRRTMTAGLMARFPPVFATGGTVTAGNSCPDADGAAAVLVTDPATARVLGFPAGLAFRGAATVGVDPARLGIGAAVAARDLLHEQGVAVDQLAAVEFNEAFAGQVLACVDLLGLDEQVLNAEGGALALGHAYGASGAVSVVRLLARSRDLPEGSLVLAMISSAGGIGTAALFEKVGL